MVREMGGRFKREGAYVHLWLIHVERVPHHSWDKVPLLKHGSQDTSLAGPWLASIPPPGPWLTPYSQAMLHTVSGRYSIPSSVPTFPPCLDSNGALSLEKAACKCARELTHRGNLFMDGV